MSYFHQECPQSASDFRSQQCNEFNNKTFKGLTYEWEPFLKGTYKFYTFYEYFYQFVYYFIIRGRRMRIKLSTEKPKVFCTIRDRD